MDGWRGRLGATHLEPHQHTTLICFRCIPARHVLCVRSLLSTSLNKSERTQEVLFTPVIVIFPTRALFNMQQNNKLCYRFFIDYSGCYVTDFVLRTQKCHLVERLERGCMQYFVFIKAATYNLYMNHVHIERDQVRKLTHS